MKIILPKKIENKLFEAIVRADKNEIGGILMGEYLSNDEYKIVDYTIQSKKGNIMTFVRLVSDVVVPLRKFFQKTKFNYRKYNYLGEWHSHPSFALRPSNTDVESMWEIVNDPTTNATFAVLLIFKADIINSQLEGNAFVFLPGAKMVDAEISIYE